ncbi:MAG: hypothetical protein ACTSX3_02520, partial [Candidatus Thorarchaeota archaeon]
RPSVAGTQEVNSIAFAPPAVTGGSHWSNWSAHSPPVLSSLLQQVTGNSMASLHPPQPPLPPTQGPQRYMPGCHLTDRHEMATQVEALKLAVLSLTRDVEMLSCRAG